MLENLTNKLIQEDWNRKDKEMLTEGAVIAANMSKIERYSCINESTKMDSVMDTLDKIKLDRSKMTFEDACEHLYECCTDPAVLEEAVGVAEADGVKRLSMTKEDYDKIIAFAKTYAAADEDDPKRAEAKRKMKTFVGTINANIVKADEVDTFIASAIRKIFNVLRKDRPLSGTSKAVIMSNIRGIKDSLK